MSLWCCVRFSTAGSPGGAAREGARGGGDAGEHFGAPRAGELPSTARRPALETPGWSARSYDLRPLRVDGLDGLVGLRAGGAHAHPAPPVAEHEDHDEAEDSDEGDFVPRALADPRRLGLRRRRRRLLGEPGPVLAAVLALADVFEVARGRLASVEAPTREVVGARVAPPLQDAAADAT